ncbi:hypothetical protein [Rhizobium sp. CCGE 510]|uniref:hypothetical protein n=1 Tax=Rhizobium sp. CCGE 510 TaxID=1132836 RepID=UPI00027B8539|nr:hypothetical protein [Rhizobium sp. CCGE 510]EJT01332.1 hypothetical protein RCCGE510_28796 [Rhizobium sp. CCGE 510]
MVIIEGNNVFELIKTRFQPKQRRLANLSLASPQIISKIAGKAEWHYLEITHTFREKPTGNADQLSAFTEVIATAVMT